MDIVVAITLFVLALLIGVEVIGKVPATLHTPLMSGANSIHGIVIAGVVIVAAHATSPLAWVFIFLAAVLGTMNVVGANDVTNPAARKPGTPVSGMPILDVDKAQNVVVMKRGRGTGYAGIQNELYFEDNTQMLFGDAKASLQAVIAAVKELIN